MMEKFLAFFFEQSLGLVSLPTILLHGTIELSAIVLAGGAGILLGRSILFHGTYPRAYSFWKAARRGVKIILGLLPYFVLAAFLEFYFSSRRQHTSCGRDWSSDVCSSDLAIFRRPLSFISKTIVNIWMSFVMC